MNWRRRLYEIIEPSSKENTIGRIYDAVMVLAILISIVPLMFREMPEGFLYLDLAIACFFVADYILRWITADFRLHKGSWSFLIYPFSLMAIIDLVSILPSFIGLNMALKSLRMVRLIRILRFLKLLRYSKNIAIIKNVLVHQKEALTVVGALALGYIFVVALIMFNIEPNTFQSFFDALYWATVSLTTVGYGDIYAVSGIGKLLTMISSIFGVAVVALPAGIITAGYMDELQKDMKK